MKKSFEIQGSLLFRNTALNLVGRSVPIIIAVITMPVLIRWLGYDSFGVLSLAWVVLGYFSFFDLGLGRATTKFVAEYLGNGRIEELPQLVWTSLGFLTLLGIIGGGTLASLTPLLVERVLNIPPLLLEEAFNVFFLLAASVPIVLLSTALRGTLEAGQRFDLVNAVQVPASCFNYVIPIIALYFGFHLTGIVLFLVISRLSVAIIYLMLCMRTFPALKQGFYFEKKIVHALFTYGGWLTVSNVVSPVLVYLDRFLIGSILSMTALAYYTPPYEIATRLFILPGSLVSTLFPAFSALGTNSAENNLEALYVRSTKYLFLIMGPLVLLLIIFSEDILLLWLGPDFAKMSTVVLRILAIGILLNSLAWVPYSLLQGVGRPDITAKFHLLELPLHVLLAWLLIKDLGITGAALAWALRVGLDAFLLFGAVWKLKFASLDMFVENGFLRGVCVLSVLAGIFMITILVGTSVVTRIVMVMVLAIPFSFIIWRHVLDMTDRGFLMATIAGVAKKLRSL